MEKLEQASGIELDRASLPPECRNIDNLICILLRQLRGGDIVRYNGLRYLVRKVRRQHVLEVRVTRERIRLAFPTRSPGMNPNVASRTETGS